VDSRPTRAPECDIDTIGQIDHARAPIAALDVNDEECVRAFVRGEGRAGVLRQWLVCHSLVQTLHTRRGLRTCGTQEIAALRSFTRGLTVATIVGMQGMIRCGVLAGVLVACGSSDPAAPDAPAPDGGGPAGLHVTWETEMPGYPGTIEDGLTVESVELNFDNLKVIGDAGPGDPRTTKSAFQLRWDDHSQPQDIDFGEAPTGLYSKVSLQLDGHLILPSLEIRGQVNIGDQVLDYEIEDRNAISLSLDCDRMLKPGGSATIALQLRLHDALTSIDFASLSIDHGKIEVETGDSQLEHFIDKFGHAFSVDNSGPD
jgi:hypothetical protein